MATLANKSLLDWLCSAPPPCWGAADTHSETLMLPVARSAPPPSLCLYFPPCLQTGNIDFVYWETTGATDVSTSGSALVSIGVYVLISLNSFIMCTPTFFWPIRQISDLKVDAGGSRTGSAKHLAVWELVRGSNHRKVTLV